MVNMEFRGQGTGGRSHLTKTCFCYPSSLFYFLKSQQARKRLLDNTPNVNSGYLRGLGFLVIFTLMVFNTVWIFEKHAIVNQFVISITVFPV